MESSTLPYPRAKITPASFREVVFNNDGDVHRTLTYRVKLTVQPRVEADAEDKLDNLAGQVQTLLKNNPLGGCYPALSRIDGGEYPRFEHPGELSIELTGTCAYLIPGANPEDSTDPPLVADAP